MQSILDLIEQRRAAYERHPFIRFLRDDRLSAQKRLSYAPWSSYFVLSFSEFNREYLHGADDAGDEHQQIVNRHADEDSTHFRWFLHDLKVLGYDVECRFTDTLEFLWGKGGHRTRELSHYVSAVARDADPKLRLVIIEAVEAMGNVWLTATLEASRHHPQRDRLLYFGQHHLDRETGHAIGTTPEVVQHVELSAPQREEATIIVDGLFDRMEAFNAELLERVHASDPESTDFLSR